MDEIAAWTRKQAEADLAAARIISDSGFEPQRWDTDPPGQVNPAAHPGSDAVNAAIGREPEYSCGLVPVWAWDQVIGAAPDDRPADVAVLAELGRREFDHVIRHDPRTETARAESVLAILEDHASDGDEIDPQCVRCADTHPTDCTDCERGLSGEHCRTAIGWPCRTVRLLAYGYRHREGWQEGWKP